MTCCHDKQSILDAGQLQDCMARIASGSPDDDCQPIAAETIYLPNAFEVRDPFIVASKFFHRCKGNVPDNEQLVKDESAWLLTPAEQLQRHCPEGSMLSSAALAAASPAQRKSITMKNC
jgi:hypothetical protein